MYQKCPICEGSGVIGLEPRLKGDTGKCPTCNGMRIISQLTGMPPVKKAVIDKYKIDKEHADEVFEFLKSTGDFRDNNEDFKDK